MGRDLHLKWQGIPWLKIALSHLMLVQQNLLLSYKGLTVVEHYVWTFSKSDVIFMEKSE